MKWLKIGAALLVLFFVGGWAYHGWILPPAAGSSATPSAMPSTVSAATLNGAPPKAETGDPKPAAAAPGRDLKRIVATDGALTEIVYALGFGDRIVAADSTAQWPHSVGKKPSIGYVRRLSAEGILSLTPTLILNNKEAGPPEAVEQLRKSGIPMVEIPGEKQDRSFAVILTRIAAVAEALGVPEKGKELIAAIEADLDAVKKAVVGQARPKALFLFNPTVEKITAGGKGTGADEFFQIAGLDNVAGSLDGWKPLSQESIIAAAPEILVTSSRSHQTFASADELLKVHGLGETPAGKARRVVYVDGSKFLSGGPRVGEMAIEFMRSVHPRVKLPDSKSAPLLKKIEELHP